MAKGKRLTPYDKMPRWKRIVVWLRYIPIAYVVLCWRFTKWACAGCPRMDVSSEEYGPWVFSRWKTAKLIRSCTINLAEMKMGRYYTMEEVLSDMEDELKAARNP